ncbi:MAG: glycosyltransferase family 4 protein [Methylobacter sp.]|nr:glycosyltransferase family 4 protein [Methylobacter sp.]
MNLRPRILFVSHSSSRNGATILLLNLLRWLKENTDYKIEILVNGEGELIHEFHAIGHTMVWRNPAFFLEALPRAIKNVWKPQVESACLKLFMAGRKYDLVYLNTSAVAFQASVMALSGRRMLWHIHEMEYALRLTMGETQIKKLFPLPDRFIVVSNAAKKTMINEFNVPESKIDLINGFVAMPNLTPEEMQIRRRKIRLRLGWPEDAFVIGGCGALGWRKGTDVFLQIADLMCKAEGDDRTHFLWVGGGGDEVLRFEHDIRHLGLSNRCGQVYATSDVMDYYLAMDVFALTSREDPFPLVMLEAGACQLPTVCFACSGGGPEYVEDDTGLIAPYLDIATFVAHLQKLRDTPELRQQLGAGARHKVQTHHVVEVQGPKLQASIERCLENTN